MKRYVWVINLGLIALAAVLAAILISERSRPPVLAQSQAQLGNMVAIAGQPRPLDDEPLFLLDTKDQVMMCYEYQIQTNNFDLRAVRRYEYDMLEKDVLFSPIGKPKKVGPRVSDIQDLIAKAAKK